jgi:ankyrin repeat protein
LHAAAVFDHAEVVVLLLEAGAAVDARDDDGFTPLLNAGNAGAAVVAALLDAGADPMAQHPARGWRPLDVFAEHGNAAGVQLILDAGVEVDASWGGITALMDAAEAGSTECVQLLLRAGADASLTAEGETASALAAKHGHHALAALLTAAV